MLLYITSFGHLKAIEDKKLLMQFNEVIDYLGFVC